MMKMKDMMQESRTKKHRTIGYVSTKEVSEDVEMKWTETEARVKYKGPILYGHLYLYYSFFDV